MRLTSTILHGGTAIHTLTPGTLDRVPHGCCCSCWMGK